MGRKYKEDIMTKAKKVLSLVLAVVMVAAMFAFSASASADQNATLTVTPSATTAQIGDVITVTVALTTDYYAGPTSVPVYYNPAVFEFVAGSVVGTDIFGAGNTDVKNHNDAATGCLRVIFVPQGGTAASAQVLNGTLFTFQLKAIANGDSPVEVKAADQKTSTNVGGVLYCGAYATSSVDSQVDMYDQTFAITNTTVTVGAAVVNTLEIKDTAPSQPTIDTANNCGYDASIYGMDTLGWNDDLTPEGAIADYLTTTLGDEYLRVTMPDCGSETTGTIIEVLDADGSTVLETYVFIYFGDVDQDGMVGSSDDFIVSYYEANYMGIDTLAQFMASDLDGDGWPTSADGFTMNYYETNYMGMPTQADVAAMAVGNAYELI